MPTPPLTVLVVLEDNEVAMRLAVPSDRRGTSAQVQQQVARLVGVNHVAVGTAPGRIRVLWHRGLAGVGCVCAPPQRPKREPRH